MSRLEKYQPVPWETLRSQAATLAQSSFVPAEYRGKTDDVLAAGLYGQEIGLGISAALSYIHVINGKPTLSAEGMLALVRSRGHSVSGATSPKTASVIGKRADTGDQMTVEWTWDMAVAAGLTGSASWKKFPQSMLWARAVSQLCRMLFPDALLGLSYTPEDFDQTGYEVIDASPTTPPQWDAEVEAPQPLKQIRQAGPPGAGDPTLYVDEDTGERHGEEEGKQENRRRMLNSARAALFKALKGQEDRAAYDTFRTEEGISLTKAGKDYTLEEAEACERFLINLLERPL